MCNNIFEIVQTNRLNSFLKRLNKIFFWARVLFFIFLKFGSLSRLKEGRIRCKIITIRWKEKFEQIIIKTLKTGFDLVLETTAGEYKNRRNGRTKKKQRALYRILSRIHEGLFIIIHMYSVLKEKSTLTLFSIPVIHKHTGSIVCFFFFALNSH